MNKDNYKSGNSYCLKDIFSGSNDKIIIPDLQRDYCWGLTTDHEGNTLVDSFMDSLLGLDINKDITMGLIYGYFDDLTPYHLQLCDGQQRLTTLFLLLGILNRRSGNNRYKDYIISNFEFSRDDREPYLQYSIRESSLYFLSDLTSYFFLDPSLNKEDITSQPWFLHSYKSDPTICSIHRAIDTIEIKLDEYKGDINCFADFVLNRLHFLFYDMNNRHNGEETFVVINTTGEPLSANQNLKPRVIIENPNYCRFCENEKFYTSDDWETMETWFWQHRRRNNKDTADEGMLAFLHCVKVLECESEIEWYNNIETDSEKFPLSIGMEKIWEWFVVYKRLYEMDFTRLLSKKMVYPDRQAHYTQKDLYAILPTMLFCKRFNNVDATYIERIYHLFYNMARYRNTTRSAHNEPLNVPAYRACQLVKNMPNCDILCLLDLEQFKVEEEYSKLEYIRSVISTNEQRMFIEELFAKVEDYNIFEGRISSTIVKWSNYNIDLLIEIANKVYRLWIEPDNQNKVRRALLTRGFHGYPLSTGNTNLTLCSGTEWRILFEKLDEDMKLFILSDESLDDIVNNYEDIQSPYYNIIHQPKYLDFALDHNIRIFPYGVIELMHKTKASSNYKIFHRGQVYAKELLNQEFWTSFDVWSDGYDCTFYTLSKKFNLTFDIAIVDGGYILALWLNRRPKMPSVSPEWVKSLGFFEDNDRWIYPLISDPTEMRRKFTDFARIIENYK